MPELFFIHEGEIVIWTQEQKLYCQFRIEEGDYAACSYLLMSACYLLDQHDLNWKHACLTESEAILDARALYPDCSLADLYDEVTMPPELRKAHQANDKAVMDAYGFTKGTEARTSESACVAALMELYAEMTK